jgi:hypothetical protein
MRHRFRCACLLLLAALRREGAVHPFFPASNNEVCSRLTNNPSSNISSSADSKHPPRAMATRQVSCFSKGIPMALEVVEVTAKLVNVDRFNMSAMQRHVISIMTSDKAVTTRRW